MNRSRQDSLRRDLLKPYMIVFLVVIAVYCGLSVSRKNISQNMERITENNLQISRLTLLIPERQKRISPFLYLEEAEKQELEQINTEILEIIKRVQDMCEKPSDDYLAYSRILEQVNGHYMNYLENYNREENSSQTHYYTGAYLKIISDSLGKYANLVMAEYLRYSYASFNRSMEQYRTLELRINVCVVIFVFVCLIYMAVIGRKIWHFLSSVMDYTGHLSRHEWNVPDMDGGRYQEFNVVIKALNSMKNEINSYIVEVKKKNEVEMQLQEERLRNERGERMLKEAGLKMLQMQIHPHFLFNTLNLIMRTVQMKENQTAVELIKSTAQILRSSISIKAALIPLMEELQNVEAYLYIQRLRYQERITFVTSYQISEAETILVPPMILQPIVENAIVHGLKDKGGGGRVELSVTEKEEYVEIAVTDNGVGFCADRILEIEQETTDRIGLLNVKKRLCFRFPNQDVFAIQTEENVGATVWIRIPKQEKEGSDGKDLDSRG